MFGKRLGCLLDFLQHFFIYVLHFVEADGFYPAFLSDAT